MKFGTLKPTMHKENFDRNYCLTPRLPPNGVMIFKRSIALSLS